MTETQMPQPRRGSRPSRRRGGQERPAGDPVATPALQNPLDFALAFMRDDSKPDALRAGMAKAALPYLHTRGEEKEDDATESEPKSEPKSEPMSDLELARRIAHILARGKEQVEREAGRVLDERIPPGRSFHSRPPSPEGEGKPKSRDAVTLPPHDERAQRGDPFDPHPGYRWI